MQLHYVNSPMYALCLLAAVCVRQHVQNGSVQPLTKNLTFQQPMPMLRKSNRALWQTMFNADEASKIKFKSTKYPKLDDANTLVSCVQNFAKRSTPVVDNTKTSIPTYSCKSSYSPNSLSDWMHFLFNNVGVKWFA